MIEAILDTVVMQHLLRKPHPKGKKKKKNKKKSKAFSLDECDKFFEKKTLRLIADSDRGLISEWEKTCGVDNVRQLLVRWTDANGIHLVRVRSAIPNAVAQLLTKLGFNDTVDKLIVRTALGHGLRTRIVSIDSDFWNPANRNDVGNVNAPVARLLKDRLGLTVVVTNVFISLARAEKP